MSVTGSPVSVATLLRPKIAKEKLVKAAREKRLKQVHTARSARRDHRCCSPPTVLCRNPSPLD